MNLNAGETLQPVFHFLDEAIADYGVYLYLVLTSLVPVLSNGAPHDAYNTTDSGTIQVIDTTPSNSAQRYYRVAFVLYRV